MDFMTTMSEVCNSSKDIKTLKHLLELHNSDNTVVIPNITRLAKDLGISRAKVNVILSKSIEHNLFKKLDIGTYLINPYIFIGRRIRSNKNRERLQKQWTELEYLK